MATSKKSQSSTKTAIEVGAGIAAAAAVAGAAGYWFYASEDATKHRKAANKWAKDMKNQVVTEAKKVKQLDQKAVGAIVDRATAAYSGVRSIDKNDLKAAASELKRNWRKLQSEVTGVTQQAKKSGAKATKSVKGAVKTAKKAVKKGAKTSPKKSSKAAKRG